MDLRIAISLALALLALACAETQGEAGKQGATTPRVRCRTEFEYRPGPLGTMGQTVPVQKCEPVEVPTLAPGDLPTPGGTPAPTTQTVPARKSDEPVSEP